MDFLKETFFTCYIIAKIIIHLLMKFALGLFIWLSPLFIMIKLDIIPVYGLGFVFVCVWGFFVFDGASEAVFEVLTDKKTTEYRVKDSNSETQTFDKEVNIRRNKSPIRYKLIGD